MPKSMDITDELLHLNADRKRSFFHRGFFEAVTGARDTPAIPAENRESRLWRLAGGIMGLLRRRDPGACARLLRESPALLDELCQDGNPFRVRMLLPVVYPILRQEGLRDAVGVVVYEAWLC